MYGLTVALHAAAGRSADGRAALGSLWATALCLLLRLRTAVRRLFTPTALAGIRVNKLGVGGGRAGSDAIVGRDGSIVVVVIVGGDTVMTSSEVVVSRESGGNEGGADQRGGSEKECVAAHGGGEWGSESDRKRDGEKY